MKQHHPSQPSTPKRSKARRARVQYQPPREETPFTRPRKFSWQRLRFIDAIYLVITVVAGSTLIGLCHASLGNYFTVRTRLAKSSGHLKQLQTREASLSQRLAHLNSPDGRDQLLRERGFVHGNERILLFAEKPAETETQTASTRTAETTPAPQPAKDVAKDADAENNAGHETSFLGGVVSAIDSAADRPTAH